jgi:hypothetical protein
VNSAFGQRVHAFLLQLNERKEETTEVREFLFLIRKKRIPSGDEWSDEGLDILGQVHKEFITFSDIGCPKDFGEINGGFHYPVIL